MKSKKKNLPIHVRKLALPILLGLFTLASTTLLAAPHNGEVFELLQPDDSRVPVKVFGDEFYQRVESLDGYSLIRDDDGWICYAELNDDQSDFASTGVRYKGTDVSDAAQRDVFALPFQMTRHIKLSAKAIKAKVVEAKSELNAGAAVSSPNAMPRALSDGPSLAPRTGAIQGLTLLIEFSDENATIPHQSIDDYCNLTGYAGFSNNGSIRDYFAEVSGKTLDYTNHVTQYYMANHPKDYYDNLDKSYGSTARELIHEALEDLEASGFDFSTLTTDDDGNLLALNVLYAGSPDHGWSNGLWPHAWSLSPVFVADEVRITKYQITNIGTSLAIGTFSHENGHMLCSWPDLYDYDGDSSGVGYFDLMASGCHADGGRNPVPPNGYLRQTCGWETPTDITDAAPDTVFSHTINAYETYRISHPTLSNEFFIIESRRNQGRNAELPDEGLMIWHVDTNGSNDNQEMTPTSHYRVSLEQADGLFQMENNINSGGSGDLFDGVAYTSFTDATIPNANWWSGSVSGVSITNISPLSSTATTMSFTFGDSSPPPSDLDVTILLDSDNNPNDNSVQMSLQMLNNESAPIDLSNFEIVYYLYEPGLDLNDAVWDNYYCNLPSNAKPSVAFFSIDPPVVDEGAKADIEMVFSLPEGSELSPNQYLLMQGALHRSDWQYNFNETDDWSHVVEGITENIVVINKTTGDIVYGNSPR